jgi:hypothetical protein
LYFLYKKSMDLDKNIEIETPLVYILTDFLIF